MLDRRHKVFSHCGEVCFGVDCWDRYLQNAPKTRIILNRFGKKASSEANLWKQLEIWNSIKKTKKKNSSNLYKQCQQEFEKTYMQTKLLFIITSLCVKTCAY